MMRPDSEAVSSKKASPAGPEAAPTDFELRPLHRCSPSRKAGTGPSSLGEPRELGETRGSAGPGHHLPQARRRGAGSRKDAAPPHTCGSLPRAPTGLGRPSSAALGQCDSAQCRRLRWARPPSSRIPSKRRHLCRVPGRLARAAAAPDPGERSAAQECLVIRPGPRAAPAGATREMLVGAGEAWRSCSRGSRCRRARPDCGLGLPQSGSLKGPRLLGLH